jgi:hypothetical protein
MTLHPTVLNPLLARVRDGWGAIDNMSTGMWLDELKPFEEHTGCVVQRPLRGVMNRKASWRRMYLCDPPCRVVRGAMAFRVGTLPTRSIVGKAVVEDVEGVKFGALVEGVLNDPDGWVMDPANYKRTPVWTDVRSMERETQSEAFVVWDHPVPAISLEGMVVPVGDQALPSGT